MSKKCDLCDFGGISRKEGLSNCITGSGSGKIMLVGDFPSKSDCRYDQTFTGSVGILMNQIIDKSNLGRSVLEDIYITNLIKCNVANKKAPKKNQVSACEKFLFEEIEKIKPEVIVPIGAVATKYFLGNKKISDVRGYVFDYRYKYVDGSEILDIKLIPTYHPKALLGRPNNLFELQSDIDKAFNIFYNGHKEIKRDYKFTGDYEKVYNIIKNSDIFAWDVETAGLDVFRDEVITCSFSVEAGKSICLPFDLDWFKKIFNLGVRNISHTKFDVEILNFKYGIDVKNWYFDTYAAIGLLNDNVSYRLKSLASIYTDVPYYDLETKVGLENADIREVALYNNFDADVTFRLYKFFNEELEEYGYKKLFFDVVMPVNRMLIDIEKEGIKVDINRLKELNLNKNIDLVRIKNKLNSIAPINWNSVQQVRNVLYNDLKLNTSRKTEGGQKSTDAKTLNILKEKHEAPKLLLESRHLVKGLGTYLLGVEEPKISIPETLAKEKHEDYKLLMTEKILMSCLDDLDSYKPKFESDLFKLLQDDGKIHNQNNINGTVSGRLTSPLHTIPREGGYRECYTVEDDFMFAGMDIKQFELRIAAHLAGDEELMTILDSENAKQTLTRIVIDKDYTEETWSHVKGVIYGVLYGRGANSIAEEFGIDVLYVGQLIDGFFSNFNKVKKLLNGYKMQALNKYFISDMVGRKRRFISKRYNVFDIDSDIIRQAVNFPIQSGSSAIFWPQVLKCHNYLIDCKSKIIHTKHDAVYFKIHNEEKYLIDKCRCILETDTLIGDIKVDVKCGKNWGEC